MRLPTRRNNAVPSRDSTSRSWWLSADCDRFKWRPAFVSPPTSATALTSCRWRTSRSMRVITVHVAPRSGNRCRKCARGPVQMKLCSDGDREPHHERPQGPAVRAGRVRVPPQDRSRSPAGRREAPLGACAAHRTARQHGDGDGGVPPTGARRLRPRPRPIGLLRRPPAAAGDAAAEHRTGAHRAAAGRHQRAGRRRPDADREPQARTARRVDVRPRAAAQRPAQSRLPARAGALAAAQRAVRRPERRRRTAAADRQAGARARHRDRRR